MPSTLVSRLLRHSSERPRASRIDRLLGALFVVAALIPFLPPQKLLVHRPGGAVAPIWPTFFENQPLFELPLSKNETAFGRDFPGAIKKFRAGDTTLIVRWISRPTRKLHPAADCFRGSGFRTERAPLYLAPDGTTWSRFTALRGSEHLEVTERIAGTDGGAWTDAPAWFWETTLHRAPGPWVAITAIRPSTGGIRD